MDYIVRAMTKDGFVKAAAITSAGIVERARCIHKTTRPQLLRWGAFSRRHR